MTEPRQYDYGASPRQLPSRGDSDAAAPTSSRRSASGWSRHLINNNNADITYETGDTSATDLMPPPLLSGQGGPGGYLDAQNPNSLSNWASSFQRSNYFIGDSVEVGSPGTIRDYETGVAQRPRLERIQSEWDAEQQEEEADQSMRTTGDVLEDVDEEDEEHMDNESFIYRSYGGVGNGTVGEGRSSDDTGRLPARRVSAISRSSRLPSLALPGEGKPLLHSQSNQGLRHRPSRRSMVSYLTGDYVTGSTIYQTTFNSVNILMGIGILSLPLGMAYAGWGLGLVLLAGSGIVTWYTALLLAKCMDKNEMLVTYADVAYFSFGDKARYVVSLIFSLELIAACTALVVLFGDSLHALVPGLSATEWKIVGYFIFLATSFVPLNILSITSILGIFATTSVILIVIFDGLVKREAPGSLFAPMATTFWPPNAGRQLPLAIGLMMGPWGGHSVFCNVYRDMRHPWKFRRAITVSYGITYLLDLSMAVCGYLMFGVFVRDEITKSVFETVGYPEAVNAAIVLMIAVVPLTKMALNTRPIATTVDVLLGIDQRVVSASTATPASIAGSALGRSISRAVVRVVVNALPVVLGIYVPEFDRIMSVLGSGLCYTICVILPISFYLRCYNDDIKAVERIGLWAILVVAVVLGGIGTVWAFL